MWRIIPYIVVQCLLLTSGQVFLKLALMRMPAFSWTRAFWGSLLVNWQFAACGLCFGLASLLWMYIVRTFPFSTSYPLVSFSYVFGMLAAVVVFHEEVSLLKWVGVVLITVGSCCLLQPVSAQTKAEGQIRQRISQAASVMRTMQCDFVQTKDIRMMNDRMVARGRMYYQQPDRLRWEYVAPYTYTFILNGDKVWLKNQQRSDVIDTKGNRLMGEIARIMMNTVVGKGLTDDKDFQTTLTETPTEWTVTLMPRRKDMRGLFRKIVLHYNRQQTMVWMVELTGKNGDKTTIELKNVRKNEAVDANLFAVH